jgi:hypothetical protein
MIRNNLISDFGSRMAGLAEDCAAQDPVVFFLKQFEALQANALYPPPQTGAREMVVRFHAKTVPVRRLSWRMLTS